MFSRLASAGEREPDTYMPYLGHEAAGVVLLDDGGLLAMLRLDGMAWETAELDEINGRHSALNVLLRNIATDRLVLSSHVVRTMDDGASYPAARCRSSFAVALDDAYRQRLLANRLYRNDLFLSVLLRPAPSTARFLGRRRRGDTRREARAADMDRLETAVATLVTGLEPYGPVRLGLRGSGVLFSEIAEALRLVLTGQREPVPLVNGHLGGAVYTDRVICGREAIEIRGPGCSTFAAGFGMREYPATTTPGMFGSFLSAPYCGVLTQSFGFLGKQAANTVLTRKQNQMVTARDKAAGQIVELAEAVDLLHSNRFVMGDHHLSLVVWAGSLAALSEVAPRARRDLAESGAVVAREDWGLEGVYWGQLPGNLALRSRPGAVSSRNFAAMAPMHNYPTGPERGHWGEALALFRTAGGTPYRFHLHASTGTVTDLGNVFMAGPAGSGKTTLLLFLLAQAERQCATTVFFDKDRGGEILVRALGGSYLVLPSGEASGLAPLKALGPSDVEFLASLITGLVSPDRPLSPESDRRLTQGLQQIMELDPEHRSFGELRAFMGQADPDGVGARLERWCKGGSLGWVLDNEDDLVALDAGIVGFDMTAVLDDATTRGPVMSYLFHRVEKLIDGRRLILAIDEFWKALLDQGFRDVVNDKLKTIRKMGGAVILATQSPRDALNSPIAHSIIEQCPTQILLPNDRADEADYIDGLKLTRPEFRAVREDLTQGGRRFLLKQGNVSVACDLDLTGLGDFVAVLSGRAKTIALMERLIERHGADWLAPFMREWRTAAA
jgi:type IV secretion system protein VirB4